MRDHEIERKSIRAVKRGENVKLYSQGQDKEDENHSKVEP
jgi:hypothetical protein